MTDGVKTRQPAQDTNAAVRKYTHFKVSGYLMIFTTLNLWCNEAKYHPAADWEPEQLAWRARGMKDQR